MLVTATIIFDHLQGYLPNSTATVGLEWLEHVGTATNPSGILQAVQLLSML